MLYRPQLLAIATWIGISGAAWAQADSRIFVGRFCSQCHGEKKPKANLSLDKLTDTPVKQTEIDTWRTVLDQLETGQMPPERAKQPTTDERQKMAIAIKAMLKKAGVSIDEARWLAPSRGNWVDHDALFSGKPVDAAVTKPRLWRLSGQAYEEFMMQKNLQFKLGIKAYGQGKIRAPWELHGQKEFSDYASSHKVGEADLEYLLRNATRVARAMVVKFGGNRPSSGFSDWIGELNIVIKAGKSATSDQVKAAVIASFDKILHRKPEAEEQDRYAGFFTKSIDQLGGERGAEQILTALLLRPEVMYRVELPASKGETAMLPRALARSISLALTDREPDKQLLTAAETGKLAAAAALITRLTNVVTITSGLCRLGTSYSGISNTGTHSLGHNNFDPETNVTGRVVLSRYRRYLAEQVEGLLRKLQDVREGSGTMLDNTVLVFTSDSANRQHTAGENWPFVLIGNLGGRLRTNQFVGYPLRARGADAGSWDSHGSAPASNPMINALYCTLLHAMSRPRETFNLASSSRDDARKYQALPELLM